VGDYSRIGGTSMGRARESLRQAGAALSDARHQLALDNLLAGQTPSVGLVAATPSYRWRFPTVVGGRSVR
jgi:hypothetical protein